MILIRSFLLITVVTIMLAACGGGGSISKTTPTAPGGGGTGGTGGTGSTSLQVSLTIAEKDSGTGANGLSSSVPLTVTATVTDTDGNTQKDKLVTFSLSDPLLAFFDPESATALTNAEGVAKIDLLVGGKKGAGLVTARLDTSESAEIGFNSTGGGAQTGNLPASLDLFGSATQLASSGSDDVELIALVKNSQNILMEGVDVTFSANSQASLRVTQPQSSGDGTARAVLTTTNKPENRVIKVTATAGSLSQELNIAVVGTEVKINAPSSVILNDNANLTIVVADSDGKGIANKTVNLSSANGNTLSTTTPTTDQTGQVTVNYIAVNSGTDVITATAFNAQVQVNIIVQQDQFSFTSSPSADIPLGANAPLTVSWLRQNAAFANGDVTFSTTRGTLSASTGKTNANGQLAFTVRSNSAGPAVISAQGKDSQGNIVNARTEVEFIATSVDSIIVEASPNAIGPDGQKSTITAVLRDAAGNLVKGKTVNFTLEDVSGGRIDPASAITDSNGLASTVYTSNTVTSENAIKITASELVSGKSTATQLTVGDRALFITLGTGNRIESPDAATYLKTFALFVTDASSNPVKDVALKVTGTPVKYSELLDPNAKPGDANYQVIRPAFGKGYWRQFPNPEAFEFWVPVRIHSCANEDVDDDAVLDPGEDLNGDTELTPGNVVSITGNVTNDLNGQATIELRYPKTFAAWTTIKITASTPVQGSESEASQFFTLSASAEDLVIESTPPNSNPFGDGQNFVPDSANPGQTIDDGTGRSCTNTL